MKKVIKVNKSDKSISLISKRKAHQGNGVLHRAFSIFIINDKEEILLQKRSKLKNLWPMFWSNTCCSHAVKNESIKTTAEKRLMEELGFTTSLVYLFKFTYQAKYLDKGSENELCYVFLGRYNGKVRPDPKEIVEYKWINISKFEQEIQKDVNFLTPWCKIEALKLKNYLRGENSGRY